MDAPFSFFRNSNCGARERGHACPPGGHVVTLPSRQEWRRSNYQRGPNKSGLDDPFGLWFVALLALHPGMVLAPLALHPTQQMIRHEAVGMDLPTGLDAGLGEGFKKPLTIGVVAENEFATVTAVQDVVNRTGLLNAKFAGHAGRIKPQERNVSRLGTAKMVR
jgi:hypothetical protein